MTVLSIKNARSAHMSLRRLATLAATAAVGAAMLAPGAANAGSMTYWSCKSAVGTPTSTEGWTPSAPWAWSSISNNCGADGGALTINGSSTNANIPANSPAMLWSYTAPADTTIGTVQIASYGNLVGQRDVNATMGMSIYRDQPTYGANQVDNCQVYAMGCLSWPLGWRNYGIGARSMHAGVWCGGSEGGYCHQGRAFSPAYRGYLEIHQAGIELVDNAAPVAGAVAGSALESRPLKGTEALTVPLTDQGVGLATYEVKLGDTTLVPRQGLAGNPGTCAEIPGGGYPAPVPCRLAATAGIQIDTTRAPEGVSQIQVTVWDAAGNASAAVDRRVTIDNIPAPMLRETEPPKVTGDIRVGRPATAVDGTWNGSGRPVTIARRWQSSADGAAWAPLPATAKTFTPDPSLEGKWLRLEVTATSDQGSTTAYSEAVKVSAPQAPLSTVSPTEQIASLTPNNGAGGNPATGRLVAKSKAEVIRAGYRRPVTLTGRLVDASGLPLAGAQVDVAETSLVAGSPTVRASVQTDGEGSWTVKPGTGSSRVVQVSYSRQRGSELYQSVHTVTVQVRPKVTLRLVRSRIGRGGKAILKGKLHLDAPVRGTIVEIQASDRGRWLTTGTARVSSKGNFKWSHRFKVRAAGSVTFRAIVKKNAALAAASNTSRRVTLRIG